MPTLDAADAAALATWAATFTPTSNGIDCPSCVGILNDTYPGLITIQTPPQTPVECPACSFTGYRIIERDSSDVLIGNIGIGRTSKSNVKLDIVTGATTNSEFHIGETNDEGAWIVSLSPANTAWQSGVEFTNNLWTARHTAASFLHMINGAMDFYNDTGLTDNVSYTPTRRMTLTTTGRLGIGIATPKNTLHVQTTGGGQLRLGREDATVSNEELGTITFGASQENDGTGVVLRGEADGAWGVGDTPGRFIVRTCPDGSATALDRITVKENGRVGIGVTTPAHLLDVKAASVQFGDGGTGAAIHLNATVSGSISVNGASIITMLADGGVLFNSNIKSGATQVASGAAANEIWKTASHATLPDNVLLIGV